MLAAFFKVSCPVCQYTFPFLERIHKAHGDKKITVVGISQNNQRDTAAFLKEYGVTFPTLLDDPNGYAVSNAYGLTNVPTLFLIGQDGKIEITSVGWVKQEVEDINRKLAAAQQTPLPPIFQPGEDVPRLSALVEARRTDPAVAGQAHQQEPLPRLLLRLHQRNFGPLPPAC